MKKYRKYGILLTTFIMLSFLTGCKTKYSSIPSETEVMEEVKKACPNESFTLVSKEETGSSPKEETYSFITDQRGLEFTATSTLTKSDILGNTAENIYNGTVTDTYFEAVKKLYLEDINNVFSQLDCYSKDADGFEIEDDSYNEEIADAIYQDQEIYSAELEYNTKEWMEKHPVVVVYVSYKKDGKTLDYVSIRIDGTADKEKVLQELQDLVSVQ